MQSDKSKIHEVTDWLKYLGVDVIIFPASDLLMACVVYDTQDCAWRVVVGDSFNCNLIALGACQWVVMAPGIWVHE